MINTTVYYVFRRDDGYINATTNPVLKNIKILFQSTSWAEAKAVIEQETNFKRGLCWNPYKQEFQRYNSILTELNQPAYMGVG